MGKILSLLLFGLLLYNMVGYSVVYLLEDSHLVGGDNAEYVEKNPFSNDIVIKVPVGLPYQVTWENPQPAEGQIRHEGEYYQMTSRQLINDTIYIHCEFDQTARDRYTSLVSRIQDEITDGHPHKKSGSAVLKNFLKEFMSAGRRHVFFLLEWSVQPGPAADRYLLAFAKISPHTPSPPPDRA